jgi:hypothetical protein
MSIDSGKASRASDIDKALYCKHITAATDAWQWQGVMIAFSNQI